MTKIKFGTDGWRAIIAQEFTVDNVARVTEATAIWLKKNYQNPSVVVGHDCRFAGELFADTVAKVLISQGVKVYLSKGFVSTPMISMGALNYKANLGIIITASHNPPEYNGYKLKGHYGGPLLPDKIEEIESIIPDVASLHYLSVHLSEAEEQNQLQIVNLEDDYCKKVEESFDLDAIRNSNLEFAYDAMYGAGQNVIRRLLPETTLLHCENNPSFDGQAPEPIAKNLQEFSEMIRLSGNIDCGLATDGDADRIGLFDSDGKFVDSHHIILLLIHYLHKYKGMNGKVCTAFSSTVKVRTICDAYNLPLDVVKIGFKYIAGIMISEDVLLGGEESGGIAIKGHIPERDGIWMGLVIWEFMAKSGKTLQQLIDEVYEVVGAFSVDRNDLHLPDSEKQRVIGLCKDGKVDKIGNRPVIRVEDMDGFKFFLTENEWLMVRASGTEPLLRVYAEAQTHEGVMQLISDARKQFGI
jgi:phosphomannomutase